MVPTTINFVHAQHEWVCVCIAQMTLTMINVDNVYSNKHRANSKKGGDVIHRGQKGRTLSKAALKIS